MDNSDKVPASARDGLIDFCDVPMCGQEPLGYPDVR
jgi:hypothetical protein